MKLTTVIALLATACTVSAAGPSVAPADPLAGAFFPPELIMLSRDQIGLTPDQQQAFRTRIEQTQLRSEELRQRLERETAALSALARQERVDETSLVAQLDRVLDAERELKHAHLGLLAWIKNLLTPEQQARLREMTSAGGTQFAEAMRRRLTEKVERVKAGVQAWVAGGRDPSAIARTMQEKVKPLLDAGKPFEADAELDRLLAQLDQDAK